MVLRLIVFIQAPAPDVGAKEEAHLALVIGESQQRQARLDAHHLLQQQVVVRLQGIDFQVRQGQGRILRNHLVRLGIEREGGESGILMRLHVQKRVGRARAELKHRLHLIDQLPVRVLSDDEQQGHFRVLVELRLQGVEVHLGVGHLMQDHEVIFPEIRDLLFAEAEVHLVIVVEHAAQGCQVGMRRGRHT